jgi:hypothetical protein
VPRDAFVQAYFQSKINCAVAKQEFGPRLELTLVIKNYKDETEDIFYDIDEIDKYLPKLYTTSQELEGLLDD